MRNNIFIDSCYLKPTEIMEITLIANELKNNTSTGLDDIPIKVIKETIQQTARPLMDIFNLCLELGIFPH